MTGTATFQGTIDNTFAGASVMFDLVTHGGHQYLAYYDENREIQVKHRTVGATDGPWDSHHIPNSSYDTGAAHSRATGTSTTGSGWVWTRRATSTSPGTCTATRCATGGRPRPGTSRR